MTPPITGMRCAACRRGGSDGFRMSKAITANTLATAARPIAATVGSSPRTTIFVNGKLKLKIRTPRPASTSPMGVDGIDDALLGKPQFEPGVAAEGPVGEVRQGESTPLVEMHDIDPCRRRLQHDALDGPPPCGRDELVDQQLAEAGATVIGGDGHPDDFGALI